MTSANACGRYFSASLIGHPLPPSSAPRVVPRPAQDVIGRLLGLRGGGHNQPGILANHLEPARDVGRRVVERRRFDARMSAEKRAGHFGNQLFAAVGVRTKGRYGYRQSPCGPAAKHGPSNGLARGTASSSILPASRTTDDRASALRPAPEHSKPRRTRAGLRPVRHLGHDALAGDDRRERPRRNHFGRRHNLRGQAIALGDVERGVVPDERHALGLVRPLVQALDRGPEHDGRRLLTLADVPAQAWACL